MAERRCGLSSSSNESTSQSEEPNSPSKSKPLAIRALKNLKNLMLLLARLIIILTIMILVIIIPMASWELYQRGREPLIIAWYSAGAFAIMAVILSIRGIVNHLLHYDKPELQRYVVRILWMVPIYAVESWFSLRFKEYHVHLKVLREAYESFVIYSFLSFLLSYLAPNEEQVIVKLQTKSGQPHLFPINLCLRRWAMGRQFLIECKWGTLQYVLVMNVCSVIVWICEICEVYHEGEFRLKSGYAYVSIVKNFSQCWALYCLVLFYQATRVDLAPVRPLGKFICVKAVVFFSFWQSIAIVLLVHQGYIPKHNDWTVENVATGLQDFLICIEMFIASVAHHFVFPYTDFVSAETERGSFLSSFIDSTIPLDIYREMKFINVKTEGSDVEDEVQEFTGDNIDDASEDESELNSFKGESVKC